jgi:hypothetical protein
MSSTDEVIQAMRREMRPLLETAMEGVLTKARSVLEEVEQRRIQGTAELAKDCATGLAEVARERADGLAEVDARWAELRREIETMQTHEVAQAGRVELNIGGYRFETSVQTLRRLPHTFFDAYFSGRYAQDVCNDGSIFVDRDGEHFGHVLEYMRDGHLSVAEPGAYTSVSLLRVLKREFGFYCIELVRDEPAVLEQPESAFVMGGFDNEGVLLTTMERYTISSGQWVTVKAMNTERENFGACVVLGEIYVTGGRGSCGRSVEKYSPSSDSWSTVASLPGHRSDHAAVCVGTAMYVLGGIVDSTVSASVYKFDSTQGTWTEMAQMPQARMCFASCAIGCNIYVFGGCNATHEQGSVFQYNSMADTWSTLTPMEYTDCSIHACVLDDLIYIVAAGDGQDVLRFDPTLSTWSTLARTLTSHQGGASFVLDGCLHLAAGGLHSAAGDDSGVERYDAAGSTWAVVECLLEARHSFCAVTIGFTGLAEDQDLFDMLILEAEAKRERKQRAYRI